MAEIATLVLGADAAGLLKGEAALNSIVKTAEKTEARVAGAMDGIADAITGTGTAATTSAKVISTADTSKARSADLAAQAIRAATATETLARTAAATAATSSATQVVNAVTAVGKQSGFAAGGGVRMLGQQLSQVAQQGAVTGNYLGALAVQLPDMALGFGSVAVAASIVATVAMPLLIGAFGNGKTAAEKAMEATEAYAASFDLIKTGLADAAALEGEYTAALISGSAQRVQAIQREADVRIKLLELDLFDQNAAKVKVAQEMVAAHEALASARTVKAAAELELTNAMAFKDATVTQGVAKQALEEATAELEEQQRLYDRHSLAFQLIQAQIDANNGKLTLTVEMLARIAAGLPPITGGLNNATGAAAGFTSELSRAMGYVAGIRAGIDGMSFTNIGLAAENAALMAGETQAAASAAGALAQEAARLAPALNGASEREAKLASETLAAKKAALDQNVALTEQRAALLAAANAADAGGAATVATMDAAADALAEADAAAKAYADALNAPVIGAIDGVSNAWGDFVSGGLRDFKGFTQGILGSFQGMLADMVAMSLRNKIMISLGMGTPAMTGVAAGAAGAAGTAAGSGMLGSSFGALGGLTGIGAGPAAGAASGLMAALPAIGAVAAGIALLGAMFKRTETASSFSGVYTGGQFDGGTSSTSRNLFGSKTSNTAISATGQANIEATLGDMRANVLDMAGSLGIGADALEGFTASIKFSTFGLSSSEVAAKLQASLGTVGSNMAAMALGATTYAKAGETQLDALTRLSQAMPQVNSVLAMLGDEVYSVGLTGADAASKLADAFGGLEAMATASKTYFDLFFSDAEKLAANTQAVQTEFARLGVAMPQTRAAYRALVAAQDMSTDAGRALYASLVSMAGAMDQVLPVAAALTDAIARLVTSAGGQLDAMISGTEAAPNAAEQAASQWYDAAKGLRDFIADLRGASSDLSSAQTTRAYNEARFQMLLAQAMAGSQSAYKDLTGAASALLDSTNSTARTSVEAALQQARVIADLDKAANVADISGGKNDVVAGLLRQQRAILTEVKDYLAAGGVLDPANIDALNGQLGALQGAIADAQSIDYAQVVASLDVTATLISKVDDPALKALLENASHEIEGKVAFTADTAGLTPAQRFLALHAATSTIRTVNLLADTTGISATDAALALATNSTALTAITATLTSTMSDQDKMLALVTSDNITRTVNMALGTVDTDASKLALLVASDIIRNVSATIAAADMDSTATRLALIASSDVTRTVITSMGTTDLDAKNLALATSSDITRIITTSLGNYPDDPSVLLGLATASVLARAVTAQLTTPASDAAVLVALQETNLLTTTVMAELDRPGSDADALTLALGIGSTIEQHIKAMKAAGLDQEAWDLGMAVDSLLIRKIRGIWGGGSVQAALDLAAAEDSRLGRRVFAAWGVGSIEEALELAQQSDTKLARRVRAEWGTNHMTAALALARQDDSQLARQVVAEWGLSSIDAALEFARKNDSPLARQVLAKWSGTGVKAAFQFANKDNSELIRAITADWSLGVDGEARDFALLGGSLLERTVSALTGTLDPNMLALALATSSPLTRDITGSVDLTGLTDNQLAFLNALTGSTGGMITLGGSFLWDPSTGFQTWLESTTQGNIADPLNALVAPMALLRAELTTLTAEIRVQNAAEAAARAAAEAAAAKAKALQDAQAAGATLLAARTAAGVTASAAVNAVNEFSQGDGYLSRADRTRATISLNASGTVNWNEASGVIGSDAQIAEFFGAGGLRDQVRAASLAQIAAERALQDARQQVIDLGGVPTFARGGMHSGGLRIVGERGPELEATGAARIYNARDTARMMGGSDNAELIREIRELRAEVKKLKDQDHEFSSKDAVLQRRMAKLMEAWDADGLLTRT